MLALLSQANPSDFVLLLFLGVLQLHYYKDQFLSYQEIKEQTKSHPLLISFCH